MNKYIKNYILFSLSIVFLLSLSACGGGSSDNPDNHENTITANSTPIANANIDQNVNTPTVVTLNGSTSSDADSDTLTFLWSVISVPTDSTATLSNSTIVNPTFTADLDGEYVFSLVVNDGTINSVADTVTITSSTANENIALNKTVTPFTDVVSGTPANVTDGNYSTVWYSYQGNQSKISFTIDLQSVYIINKLVFATSQTRNYMIESSTDNINWTTEHNLTGLDYYNNTTQNITINPTYTARYLRYTGTNGDDMAYIGVIEFEVYGLITYNGTAYGTVKSPYTGKVWLDRNLGASQVCTSINDTECYGNYYQWGRNTDGHEKSNSIMESAQATDINNSGTDFIEFSFVTGDWTTLDVNGSLRSSNWNKTDGTAVCPLGYRVPTIIELEAETINNGVNINSDAYNNFLKLPSAGYRYAVDGTFIVQGERGYIWSSSDQSPYASIIYYDATQSYSSHEYRANGLNVRCIKD